MAGRAAFPLPVCCRCSASLSPQDLVLAAPKPFGPGTHQESMSLPMTMAFSLKLSSLYHGYQPERCILVPVRFVENLETYKRLPCHFCPQPASSRWHQAQGAVPEPTEGCVAPVPGNSGKPTGIPRTKRHSRMEGRGKASHPKRPAPSLICEPPKLSSLPAQRRPRCLCEWWSRGDQRGILKGG